MEYLAYAQKLLWIALAIPLTDFGIILVKGSRQKLATAKLGSKRSLKGLLGENGIQLSKNITLTEKQSQSGVVIIAPTRTGKTTEYFIPNLLQNNLKGSLIIPDPKGELWRLTHKAQESFGRIAIQYSPLWGKINYDCLENCKDSREVSDLSQCLLSNGVLSYEMRMGKKMPGSEWLMLTQNLLTAVLIYCKHKHLTISNAVELIIFNTDDKLIDKIQCDKEALKYFMAYATSLAAEKTTAGIKTTLTSCLSLFLDNLNIRKSDFTPEELRKTPTALYITYPENKSSYLSPLMATFYNQFIDHIIDCYTDDSLNVWFMGEEFLNIGMLPNLVTNIATAASRRVGFSICAQSISQIKQIYGEYNTLTILNNCKNKIILPTLTDLETLRYISEICGDKEIETISTTLTGSTKSKTTRNLLTKDEIRRLQDDELLCIINNRLPLIDKQNIYYNQTKYKVAL